jgi:hypothetical protein
MSAASSQSLAKTGMPVSLASASASVLFPVQGTPENMINFIPSPLMLLQLISSINELFQLFSMLKCKLQVCLLVWHFIFYET